MHKYIALSVSSLVAILALLVACNQSTSDDLAGTLYVYRDSATNPYRGLLIDCIRSASQGLRIPCSLEQLPFIGMDSQDPTLDDLLNRVVVSHTWMGQRFQAALESLDREARDIILQLSKSITGVMIGANVRPSYYTAVGSIIFLDPLLLALDENEVRVINTAPDFRSNYGSDLQFGGAWRYVTASNEYLYNIRLETRTLQDVSRYLARLFFHELAHANDYYPHGTVAAIDCAATPAGCQRSPLDHYVESNRISAGFGVGDRHPSGTDYHLHDRNMEAYAAARYLDPRYLDPRYLDREATDRLKAAIARVKAATASEIGGWLAADVANHDYAYTNSFEDIAMLTEATLVKYLFDADMDIGYIPRDSDGVVYADTPIGWGVRGRIGSPDVRRRAKQVITLMLPNTVPDSFFNSIPAERAMNTACGWTDNIDLVCDPLMRREGDAAASPVPPDNFEFDLLDPHHSH